MKKQFTQIASFFLVLVLIFTVFPVNVQASSNLKLNKSKVTIYTGGTITLKVTGTSGRVKFSSNKRSVAAVNSQGKVTAKKAGTAVITAKAGSKKLTCRVTVKKENVKLNKSKVTLYTSGTTLLKVTGTSRKASFVSSRKSVATVSSSGKITAKKAGTAAITAKVGNKKVTCKVTVKKENLKLDRSRLTLYIGESKTLKATGTSRKVSFSTSRKAVATVSRSGRVAAKKAGTATITAKVGSKKVICKVTVKVKEAPKPVARLSKTSDTVLISYSRRLSVSGNSGTVTWKSSNSSIATVDSRGIVTGKKAGTATITARVDGMNLTCKVTVPKYRLHIVDFRGDDEGNTVTFYFKKDVREAALGHDWSLGQRESHYFRLAGTKPSDRVTWELVGSKKGKSMWGGGLVDRNTKAGIDGIGNPHLDTKEYRFYYVSNINNSSDLPFKNGSTELRVRINGKVMFTVQITSHR